jgi:hypothetical protein
LDIVNGWLLAIIMFEFALAAFLLFATKHIPWYVRMIGAFFALGCGIICAVFVYYLVTDPAKMAMDMDPKLTIFSFVFANIFGFLLIRNLKDRPLELGCFGTGLRMAGCVVAGWAMFALATLGVALLIGLGGYLGR